MTPTKNINTETLRNWLETGKEVSIIDIRPIQERVEWYIPQSIHINAYDKLKANDKSAFQGLHLEKHIPVVVICAGVKTSLIGAEILQNQGFEAYSLEGGMKAWSLSWNTAKITFPNFEIIQLRRTGKGCLSYIVISNNEAIIVDASLSTDIYEQILEQENLTLKCVIETHIHADHISRSKQLAENNTVPLFLPHPNKVIFDFEPINNNTILDLGSIKIKAIKTPGHTLESTTFLIDEKVLLSGDTLFTNGVGRPDLKANNNEALEKAKKLYQSLQMVLALDENTLVLPSHTSQPVDFDNQPIQTTIGFVKKNVAMLQLNEKDFTDIILQRIPPTPTNYLEIVALNLKGDLGDINPIDLEAGANRCAIS
ncbi:MBL fold metallo-hydrolase [Flavobacterium sufflavum]|uniref:MBL fold metallo-hydrolase n=1 Tax=Flavobacterium sufflavum TaxID=1921138 RepID=A0A3S2WCJ8_9FLAO|nr:MBL fold metallo-hydrolase [Flavobacterium sufflavum]RVT75369.1 MBL fold metallo-hydrolase [Flavobacterium sufflavum]